MACGGGGGAPVRAVEGVVKGLCANASTRGRGSGNAPCLHLHATPSFLPSQAHTGTHRHTHTGIHRRTQAHTGAHKHTCAVAGLRVPAHACTGTQAGRGARGGFLQQITRAACHTYGVQMQWPATHMQAHVRNPCRSYAQPSHLLGARASEHALAQPQMHRSKCMSCPLTLGSWVEVWPLSATLLLPCCSTSCRSSLPSRGAGSVAALASGWGGGHGGASA